MPDRTDGSAARRRTLLGTAATADLIHTAVREHRPFSLVRLGDGEGVAMSVGDESWLRDLVYLHSHWGAEQITIGDLEAIRDLLWEAVRHADVVGVREDVIGAPAEDLTHLAPDELVSAARRTFDLRPSEARTLSPESARRLALLHCVLGQFVPSAAQQWCSAWIHWDLQASGALYEAIEAAERVMIVGSNPSVAAQVEQRFAKSIDFVETPDKVIDGGRPGDHVPRRLQELRETFRLLDGTLVLVGAGIPGKIYCHWAQQAGAVAVDVGAVLDAWVGRSSRPRVMEARFGGRGERSVPDQLRLSALRYHGTRTIVPKPKVSRTDLNHLGDPT